MLYFISQENYNKKNHVHRLIAIHDAVFNTTVCIYVFVCVCVYTQKNYIYIYIYAPTHPLFPPTAPYSIKLHRYQSREHFFRRAIGRDSGRIIMQSRAGRVLS